MKPKKLLSFILATVMILSVMPTFALTASAATSAATSTTSAATEKNITLGKAALSGYDSAKGSYKYIYYGEYADDPIMWRILTMNGNEGTYKDSGDNTVASSDAMFLLSEYALEKRAFDSDGNTNHPDQKSARSWRYSDVWNWCNGTFKDSSFTDSEKTYLLKTSRGVRSGSGPHLYYTDELEDDTFFLLKHAEAEQLNGKVAKMSNATGETVQWWLLSDGEIVFENGDIFGASVMYSSVAVRPAFNLDSSKILFTTAAEDGKKTALFGELFRNETYSGNEENGRFEYKLTMLDESRSAFSASLKEISGDMAAISYSGATVGANEYVSVIIKNGNDVKYYGRIAAVSDASDASGEVTFHLPDDYDELGGDSLYVFSEQYNGDYETDYASNLVELSYSWYTADPSATEFTIYTASELCAFANLVNGTDGRTATEFEGKTVKLGANIDLSGIANWTPISKFDIGDNHFKGTFDGAGYKITGLKIDSNATYVGLFGFIENVNYNCKNGVK